MHFDMGSQYLRAKYITQKQFLNSEYDQDEVYVQTTERSRTIDSATAQLQGIFNRNRTFPGLDPELKLDVVTDDYNLDIHLNADNCPRFGQIQSSVQSSSKNLMTQASIASIFEDQFFPSLRERTGMLTADTPTMFDVSNYLLWAQMSQLDLIIDLTDDDQRYLNAANSNDVWADYLAYDEEVSLSSFDFMN